MIKPIAVLQVDHEESFMSSGLDADFLHTDFTLDHVSSSQEAMRKLKTNRYAVIIARHSLPDMDGIALFRTIHDFLDIPFILVTDSEDDPVIIDALRSGIEYVLAKGRNAEVFYMRLTHLLKQVIDNKRMFDQYLGEDSRFCNLFEKSSTAILLYHQDGELCRINSSAEELFSLPHGDGYSGCSLFHYPGITDEVRYLLRAGTIVTFQVTTDLSTLITHQGSGTDHSPRTIDVTIIPDGTADERISSYFVEIVDRTQQIETEDHLKRSHDQLGLAIEGSRLGLWDWMVQTGETTFNERWAEIVGYTLAELSPTSIDTWIRLTHPDDLRISNERIHQHISGELPYYECIARMRHKNGHWVYVQDRGKITEWDDEGRPIRMTGTHIDISEQKNAELLLQKKTEEIEQFFSVSIELLCIATTDGYFTRLNPAWEEVLGWKPAELLSQRFLEYVHPEDRDLTLKALSSLSKQNRITDFVNRYRCKDGSYRWIEWRSVPVKETIYAAARDITEQRLNEERLLRKRNILDAISFAATSLMSSLSDEAITNVIARVGMAVEVSRTYIFIHTIDPEGVSRISQRYEWVQEGILAQQHNPILQNLDWLSQGYVRWASVLMNGGVISGLVHDFPPEEQPALREQNILSLVVVPIFSHDEFFGFIGFDHCIQEHQWTDVEIETLEAAAGLLGASFGRKKAEEEVLIRDNNLNTFFNSVQDFLFVLDPNGLIEQVNETVIRRLGYTEEEIIGHSVLNLHPDERINDATIIIESMVAGTCDYCSIPLKTKHGDLIPVETRIVSGIWNGHPVLFGVSKDISAIALSEEKFSKAFHTSGSLMVIASLEWVFLDVNRTFLETLGYTWEEVIGREFKDLGIFPDNNVIISIHNELLQSGNFRQNRLHIKTSDNRLLSVVFSSDIIYVQDRTVILIALNDVTEITRLSDALLQANKKLNLLSSITRHDILNQVQALMFLQSIFAESMIAIPSLQEDLELFNKTVDTIYRQILFTRDYQDMGIVQPTWQRVEDVVLKERGNKIFSQIQIVVTTDTLELFADPMFSKVIFNLCENALRHGGDVSTITVSFHETGEHGVLVVEDDGVGVPIPEKNQIFKRGFGKNTGFGLFLAAEILSITGIIIQETGIEGTGARFELFIPLNGFRYHTY